MGFGIYSCILCLVNALALNCISMHLFLSMLGHSYTHKLQIKRVPSPAQSLDSNAQLQPTVGIHDHLNRPLARHSFSGCMSSCYCDTV